MSRVNVNLDFTAGVNIGKVGWPNGSTRQREFITFLSTYVNGSLGETDLVIHASNFLWHVINMVSYSMLLRNITNWFQILSEMWYASQKRAHWETSPVKSGVPISLCELKQGFKGYRHLSVPLELWATNVQFFSLTPLSRQYRYNRRINHCFEESKRRFHADMKWNDSFYVINMVLFLCC